MDLPTRLIKRPLVLLAVLAAILPWSLTGAMNAFRSTSNRVEEWLPADFSAAHDLDRFVQWFGSDELLMIAWEGYRLGDSRAEQFKAALLEPPIGLESSEALFRRVMTPEEVMDVLQDAPLNLTRAEALERIAGWLTSQSGDESGLIALVSKEGAANRRAARDHVLAVAKQIPGLSSVELHMAGPTIEGVAIDDASQSRLWQLNLLSFAVCFLVMAVSLRNLRAAVLILALALFCEQLCLAIVWYSGGQMDSILLLAANLTFVLSISIGIHLFNYYRDARQDHSAREAPIAAFHASFKPTSLSVFTSAVGLASLTVSTMLPIKKFGIYSAISLVAAMVVVLICLPAHFYLWPLRAASVPQTRKSRSLLLVRLAGAAVKRYNWVLIGSLALLFVGASQLPRLRTSVGLVQLLPRDNPLVRDYRWLENRIGPLIPVEIVLSMPSGNPRAVVEQYRAVADVHQQLGKIPETTVISSVNFSAEPPPRKGGFRQLVRATAFRRALVENQQQLADLGYVRFDNDRHHWRVTLRTSALEDKDYGHLLDEISERVDHSLAESGLSEQVDAIVTGGVPLIYQAQQHVLSDLIASFTLAFSLVAIALMFVFRSLFAGLLCMLPNVLPTAIVFGWLAWRGQPVEVGAVLTASAALGISVDDSLHFITWFQKAAGAGASAMEAAAEAYRRCGFAMVQTTLTCGLGLYVFAWSEFLPIVRFSGCITALLALALAADLIVLPALLVSPVGALFLKKNSQIEQTGPFQTDLDPARMPNQVGSINES